MCLGIKCCLELLYEKGDLLYEKQIAVLCKSWCGFSDLLGVRRRVLVLLVRVPVSCTFEHNFPSVVWIGAPGSCSAFLCAPVLICPVALKLWWGTVCPGNGTENQLN